MLEGHVEVGKYLSFRHQRDQVVDAGVGIDVVQAHPESELAQFAAQLEQPRLHRPPVMEAGAVLDVDAVGAGVLRNHQQFPDAGRGQHLGLAQYFADRARHQVAAQRGNDAEGAAVVAAFGNLQVGIMVGRQADALRRHQVDEGIMRGRQVRMHRLHHFPGGMRTGDGEHLRMHVAHDFIPRRVLPGAEAAGDDDLAVFRQRFADGVERFLDRGIDEAAGIDHHEVSTVISAGDFITLGAQPGQDLFRVGRRLGAAQRHEADGRRAGGSSRHQGPTFSRPCPRARRKFRGKSCASVPAWFPASAGTSSGFARRKRPSCAAWQAPGT